MGPGDPDLITVKAVKILGQVDAIFTASATTNDFSLALDIARPHLPDNLEVHHLSFPMTKDEVVTDRAWRKNADTIAGEVSKGKDVAFLTLGDPLTYSTFGYILQKMQEFHPGIAVETIPGITSYQAAAARINRPLVEAEESLLLTSGAFGGAHVRKVGDTVENVVLLKAYKNVPDIIEALDDADMLENSVAVSKCGREDESITREIRLLAEREPDYWTLVIAKKEKLDT